LTIPSPLPARKSRLPNRETRTIGSKYIAKNAKGFAAHSPLYRPGTYKLKTGMKNAHRKTQTTDLVENIQPPQIQQNPHRFSYTV
jgi:hypothetical protein